MEWYSITPVDTLFFKGAEPMNIGENHTASFIFPPPAHTISGALRTAVLVQYNISFKDYGEGKVDQKFIDVIGKAGENASFQIVGPFFMENDRLFIPAPFTWFSESESENQNRVVYRAEPLRSRLLKTGVSDIFWASSDKGELVSLGGLWIDSEEFNNEVQTITARTSDSFFVNEPRTGIALELDRRVRDGCLYTFNHTRLKKGVRIVFGTDKSLPLPDRGSLKLGGEQRICWYEKKADFKTGLDFSVEGQHYMALSVVEGTVLSNESVLATGKIQYFGGWDLNRGFHKPMKGFFPAGSVFNKKISNNLIAIKGVESC